MFARRSPSFGIPGGGGLWHSRPMLDAGESTGGSGTEVRITPRLISGLYTEAMLLADEVRSYFDEPGRIERDKLSPIDRVSFSCEALKVTTRLMHAIAWLLTQRAVEAGEISPVEARTPSRRLGVAPASEPSTMAKLPDRARSLIEASHDLYDRLFRLDESLGQDARFSPARNLFSRLEAAF